MAHLNEMYSASNAYLPWLSFLVGLSGSAHCVGMCGGLVVSTTSNLKQNFLYQIGRLVGYAFVGLMISSFGYFVFSESTNQYVILFTSSLMGLAFIYLGLKNWFRWSLFQKGKTQLFTFLQRKMARTSVEYQKTKRKPLIFYMGLFSIFLPCGFLYSFALVLSSVQSSYLGIVAMVCFWLGTLPALMIGPGILNKVLGPLNRKSPWIASVFLILLGIMTILYRWSHIQH